MATDVLHKTENLPSLEDNLCDLEREWVVRGRFLLFSTAEGNAKVYR